MVRGHLVLENEPYSLADVPEPARSELERRASILIRMQAEGRPNACFALVRAEGAETYAGLGRVGLTRWAQEDSIVRVPLYGSPDAGYLARLSVQGDRLRGSGRSRGTFPGAVDTPPDSIIGRRVGPPDRSLCIRAAEAEAARRGS